MNPKPRSADALARLEAVFRETGGAELHDTDVAELTGLDEEECRALLASLREAGAIEERRNRVYIGQAAGSTSAAEDAGSSEL
jgi:transcription initiation factor IIE alpha subunit